MTRIEPGTGPVTAYPRNASLIELFGRWVERSPQGAAIKDGERQWSYAELDGRADSIAHALVRRGIGTGCFVGISGPRQAEAVAAFLGVLKTGAAYVPLDESLPASRLAAMTEDIGVSAVITLPRDHRDYPRDSPTLAAPSDAAIEPVVVDRAISGGDLAYIMFTSGSTGPPKAVAARQRGVTRLVVNTNYVALSPQDRVLQVSSLSFDASTFEIWGALLNGGCLVLAESKVLLSPTELRRQLDLDGVTVAFVTTAIFHQLAQRQPDVFSGLSTLLAGGETMSLPLAQRVLGAGPPTNLYNVYGPTENTTFTTAYRLNGLPADATTVPIGTPIAHTTCYILRPDGSPVAIGEDGELCVGGDGVAVGYLNDSEQSARRFPLDPFSADGSARMYRTGDVARWRDDGNIEYRGRRDRQMKIHGYRIEPEEVEASLRDLHGVADAVVTRHDDADGHTHLVAYVTAEFGQHRTDGSDLRERLATHLPPYLIPTVFVWLDQFPLGPHGKVDRTALPSAESAVAGARSDQEWASPVERIRAVWIDVLRARGSQEEVGLEDTVFDLGGESFDVLRIHDRISVMFDLPDLSPLDLFTYPTLAGYVDRVQSLLGHGTDRSSR